MAGGRAQNNPAHIKRVFMTGFETRRRPQGLLTPSLCPGSLLMVGAEVEDVGRNTVSSLLIESTSQSMPKQYYPQQLGSTRYFRPRFAPTSPKWLTKKAKSTDNVDVIEEPPPLVIMKTPSRLKQFDESEFPKNDGGGLQRGFGTSRITNDYTATRGWWIFGDSGRLLEFSQFDGGRETLLVLFTKRLTRDYGEDARARGADSSRLPKKTAGSKDAKCKLAGRFLRRLRATDDTVDEVNTREKPTDTLASSRTACTASACPYREYDGHFRREAGQKLQSKAEKLPASVPCPDIHPLLDRPVPTAAASDGPQDLMAIVVASRSAAGCTQDSLVEIMMRKQRANSDRDKSTPCRVVITSPPLRSNLKPPELEVQPEVKCD
ncbi:uncharacterized protein B0H64DRAFT_369914 [Chaetomium fimeti]|uniref:Uncharacterized protein n=1 Tax=Chaetomium fimeti TaxID=1854472 RepID=A0AAE0HQH8_9PEZI|nr:hypothetical protein B0H64DRAFT_369914 [Chaetomium fimeti]